MALCMDRGRAHKQEKRSGDKRGVDRFSQRNGVLRVKYKAGGQGTVVSDQWTVDSGQGTVTFNAEIHFVGVEADEYWAVCGARGGRLGAVPTFWRECTDARRPYCSNVPIAQHRWRRMTVFSKIARALCRIIHGLL
jgi:hypothetical protein